MQRNKTFDFAKGVGILFVLWGHIVYDVTCIDTFYCWMWSFHMPLFMFASGYLTSRKDEPVLSQVINKGKKILVPYVICNVIGFLVNRIFGFQNQTLRQFIRGILGGNNLNSNLPSWYLLAFFWVSMFAILILPKIDSIKYLVLAEIVSVILIYVMPYIPVITRYLKVKSAIVLLPFFIGGYLLRKLSKKYQWKMLPFLIPLFFIAGYYLEVLNRRITGTGYINVTTGKVNIPILYLMSAYCSIFALLGVSRYLSNWKFMSIINYLGKNSLFLLCSHWILMDLWGLVICNRKLVFLVVLLSNIILIFGKELLKNKGKIKE